MLDRRTAGADGGATVSAGLQRHRIGSARDQLGQTHTARTLGRRANERNGEPSAGVQAGCCHGGRYSRLRWLDGVKDGVIEDPKRCTYDPEQLIGSSAGDCGSFTKVDVDLIRKFWQGPQREAGSFLWYGQARGADLTGLYGSRGTPLKPQAFGIALDWLRYLLAQDPRLDWTTIKPAD